MINKFKLLFFYIIFSTIWIVLTDNIIVYLNIPKEILIIFQNIKGFIFVIITSIFIYYLILKKEAYESEKAENNKLHILINSMVDFVNFKDGEGRWIEANDFALKLFQVENVNYRGKTDAELAEYTKFYGDALRYCETSDEQAWLHGTASRCIEEIPMPDGTVKTFDTIKIPSFSDLGERKELVVMGRDVTEKVLAENKLAESEQKYKSLFEFNPELVYMIDIQGRLIKANEHFYRCTGYEINQFLNQSILPIISRKDRSKVFKAFIEVIHGNNPWINEEIEIVTKNNIKKVLRCTAVPMIINDKTVGAIGYAADITKEKETEELLRKTEKLSVVGELAASVAHEIRNPLTSIKGFIQMMQSSTKTKENDLYYKIMLDELERINIIASELLVLSKPQKIKFQEKDINILLSDVYSLLESEANLHNVLLKVETNDLLPKINCEPNQLKQLFINLIKNSIEASSKNIIVSLSMFDDHSISLVFTDDGCGIEEKRLKHLGEPFYSMKEKGTGLGLTVSYRIVEFHNGEIKISSEVNQGTKVQIILPVRR
ncbi:PAS domain-containing sensor histidine kinase [Metabacillus litoralis]|uniref:PAS domain-containing sensor histidine kinase n=1 Tax=Metabacillus litoralis TaxID=152268 RepID=UPI001CFDDDD6|nr:PAS domain-containing sensor histidine kinase [Metabacillus litoralis]